MADTSNITWTDRTFNPWWGCTKISPGCDHCYAEVLDRGSGGAGWEKRCRPRTMSNEYWRKPHRWQQLCVKIGRRLRVFCGSMCDVFDNQAPVYQRKRLWGLIKQTPALDWLLLTKRAPNIVKMLPTDWGRGYPNVWLGVTVENKKHGLPRINRLRSIPTMVRFLSIQPLLEDLGPLELSGIDWVIAGEESGPKARKMNPAWLKSIRKQCQTQQIVCFFKLQNDRFEAKSGCLLEDRR